MKPDIIDKWAIVKLYLRAKSTESYIEVISLGYTMLEMQLTYLLRSTANPSGKALKYEEVDKCKYLIELADLARKKKFIDSDLYQKIKNFNKARRSAIHKLLTETVTMSELKDAANSVTSIYSELQSIWLPIKIGEAETAPRIKK